MVARRSGLLSRGAFLLACLALLGSCKTAGFKDVFMSTDTAGKRKTRTFPTEFVQADSGMFCQVTYSSGRDDAELKVYVTPPSEDTPATPLNGDSIILSKGDGQLTIQIGILTEDAEGKTKVNPAGPFEVGDYRLDFYIDDSKEDSITFSVQEPELSEAPE
jgi:hypothetical protein